MDMQPSPFDDVLPPPYFSLNFRARLDFVPAGSKTTSVEKHGMFTRVQELVFW